MARRTGTESRFAWSTIFYLLLVLLAPMVLFGSNARAQESGDKAISGPMKGGKVEILVNDQGNRITPSYVAWNDEERLVGDAGKHPCHQSPTHTC
jgi:heat shock protein 5